MTIAGIKVLIVGKPFNLPYNVVHLEGTAHLLETIATFRPDVIVTSNFIPGGLTLSPHELRKRWIHVPTEASVDDVCNSVESCYTFNIWTEHQYSKDHPIVSVYTPTHDTGDYLQDTYQSLKNQTYANWEWVIVDDHSSDKTWARLQEFAAQDYRIRPFQSAVHIGKIGALKELTTRLCRGKYLVELDHDDMLTDTALEEVKTAFETNPTIGMVYTNSASFYENGEPQHFGGEPWEDPDRYREIEYHGRKYLECNNPNIYDRFGPHFTQVFGWFLTVGPHHIRAFRAETFRQLGGYNPELPVADDWDLYARFFLESQCLHLDRMLYLYRYRDASGNATYQRFQEIQDHLSLARNHYAARFETKNKQLLRSAPMTSATGISFIVLDATGSINAVACLKSLRKYAPGSEVILVENGRKSQARPMADIVLSSYTNLGFGAGCNFGAGKASKSHLCFINDDAELVDESTIKKLLEAVKQNVIAGVYSDSAKPPQGNWTQETAPSEDQSVPMVVGLCMVLSKSLFELLGGFDPRFLTWEDDDLCTRANRLEVPSIIVGGTFVHHKGHQTFEAMKLDREYVESENKRLFNQKHPKIKVIAIAKNEENCIIDFFRQFESITKDWYLLDTGSTDRTVRLAQSIGVHVESEPFVDFATMRNRALELFDPTQDSWVIQLDPDERLDKNTIEAIPELIFSGRSAYAYFETYIANLTAVYPDGSKKNFVPKWFLAKNSPKAHWTCKVHEKWVDAGPYALVTNALIEHRIEFHTGQHREGSEELYAKLMSEEPYFQDPAYKAKLWEDHPILDYDRLDDPRISKIQAGPLVSVLIATYKRPELLRKAVASALNQTWKNLEVIIVGDACPELESATFDDRPYASQPRVRVANLPTNTGGVGSVPRIIGINMAAGEYIAYLDDDNTWAPDHIITLLGAIIKENALWGWSSMMVNGTALLFDRLERGKIDTSCVIHNKKLISRYGSWKPETEVGYANDFELFSRWKNEPHVITQYPSVNYNSSTSGQADFLANLTSDDRVKDLPYHLNTVLPSEPNLLTIGILGLASRTEMRVKLVQELETQRKALPCPDSVRILFDIDEGAATVGKKRQRIVDACATEYICFVDDDDWISSNYLASTIRALQGRPDCVTFKGVVTTDGGNPEAFRFSLHYPVGSWTKDGQGTHQRTPNHLCPIKLELARKIQYKDVYASEDFVWAKSIYQFLNSQCHIDDTLYYYRYSPSGSEASKRGPKLIPNTFFRLGQDKCFYDARDKAYSPEEVFEILTNVCSDQQVREFVTNHMDLFEGRT